MSGPDPRAAGLQEWYGRNARPLPWRRPGTTPWGVLVSEVMLQQTPVARVAPVWEAWIGRWPAAADLARESPGEAIRVWGRLGYPRRALRLHAAATALTERFDGAVPADLDDLLALPGVGDYTARAVLAFAFGRRVPVVDVNVRRVTARLVNGRADGGPATTRHDLADTAALLPDDDAAAAVLSAALMELGATVCTARLPRCGSCPVSDRCGWRLAGAPPGPEGPRRSQAYVGTDRYVRGLLLGAVREARGSVSLGHVDTLWPDREQRKRALTGLLADGLITPVPTGEGPAYGLPR